MKYLFYTAMLLCAIAVKGYGQEAAPNTQTYNFTVQDCVNYAYEHQNTVVNSALDIKSAEYKVKETTGIGLPQISGSASFQDYLKIPTTLLPGEFFGAPGTFVPVKFGVKYQSNLGLSLNQILFNGSYLVGLKASKTYRELSQRNYTRSKIEANVAVTKAYYQVLVSDEQIKLYDANIAQLKQQVDQTVAQNKQGFVEKIDVDRITVQYNNLITNRENVIRSLALNYQMLKFQMGMPVDENLVLKDKLSDISLDKNVAELAVDTGFYHNRIEYSLQETQKKLNELDLQNKKSTYLPTLSANGSYAASYQDNNFSKLYSQVFPSSYVGLTLNVPIFSGGQRLNQVRQAKVEVQKSTNDLVNLKNTINLDAKVATVSYINGLQSLNNQKRNQQLAQEVLRVSKIKYQQGVGSSIEVTQAQTSLEDADNQYIQGLYEALVSKVDLDKAYGRIK
ncbi:Outer membrane protein TolC [Mucilaginibacter gossypiicola]|uniref:Outer membrane protein TolC n=1 Tax=Mucilaginibacter gossypiicola TaxID=551995 RepID=A0A1H8UHQ3_9SPHI|nr:TolC family protein [Mucilaginibacter gossypiicola]SEP02636.1 Outer membrane protein TolC [Mucilaginibacter gossypiicola]